ncbi:hypothetical protein [Peribacillus frigoritolerans]|uniref:hypothetical protein n=1 Tax=Peribacillus frigoritolerans TaxID=450367 RepID=UPI002079ADB4|nr:hypothetical protein [Peribacillus frigoritolerans]USK64442.1 hypothetical protein LIT26_25355 [Peribacillus frigoritolerans]
MFFLVPLIGWKKFSTLLPYNWLAETPQTLESRRLGSRSAERELIAEISWKFIEKTAVSERKLTFSFV